MQVPTTDAISLYRVLKSSFIITLLSLILSLCLNIIMFLIKGFLWHSYLWNLSLFISNLLSSFYLVFAYICIFQNRNKLSLLIYVNSMKLILQITPLFVYSLCLWCNILCLCNLESLQLRERTT